MEEKELKVSFDQIPSAELVRTRLSCVMSEARKLREMLKTSEAIEKENQRKQGGPCPS